MGNWKFPQKFPWKTETVHRMEGSLWTQVLKEEEFFNNMGVSGIDLFFYFCWLPLLYSEKTLTFALMEVPPFFFFSLKKPDPITHFYGLLYPQAKVLWRQDECCWSAASGAAAQGEKNSSCGCHNQSYITVNVPLEIRLFFFWWEIKFIGSWFAAGSYGVHCKIKSVLV